MTSNLPALVIIVPLLASLVAAGAGWFNRKAPFYIAVIALLISFISSVLLLAQVVATGVAIEYQMAGWPAPVGIVYVIDHLSAMVLVVITFVAFVNLIGNRQAVETEFKNKEGAFNALYVLFTAGLVGMTATGDAFNLYVLLEIASLSGYALIGLGSSRAPLATLNYLFLGTIGATFYLLGVGYLYIATGSLNMADLATIIPSMMNSSTILFAFIICLTGLLVKMAIFPVHGWLPGAYSESSTVSAGLIAPLTTKVTIYIMVRICLTLFTPEYTFGYIDPTDIMVAIAVASIIFGSLSALAQKDFKRMLSYIIIAEVGYMVGGFFLGNRMGVSGAILHIVNDAAMTLALFMAAGIFIWKTGDEKQSSLKGLYAKMPFTMAGFTLAALSVVGVPPTCGFFSKWYLISGGIAAGQYLFVGALIFSSLINAVLFFRIFEIALFEPFKSHHHAGDEEDKVESHHGETIVDPGVIESAQQYSGSDSHDHGAIVIKEPPLPMLVPFLGVCVLLLILGLYSGSIVNNIIHFAIPAGII
ncbi:NADH-quinone oxidoreductase subunit N [Desulfamplus magnetovallimortis]|uniref:NADH-quinone oxidoreductase subunit N n=1 Tax=Desulfamplus magnetovallimortis TaxID=1246637 RepID=A0A1W1H8X5_9BACT|nr:proton-conducting transporter membrane subunit [Desulfamplus magnetovallimortis]SLM28937.1 NADH-quinone oxidoreductase subunit N [Desulfamplus magnetovallimortis]